ncbi:extensin-like domain-containing protein [Pseudaminobacter sp. NGMCC 1.201702]|uniref:extensin-like domain-containing protein n=1 Tax=Pseudaminobacter sp. NGMCC 1.201702 TaxID=3391825 RepID=UPI0039EEFD66
MAPFRAMLARAQKSGSIRLLAGGAAALFAAGLASSCTTESLMNMRPDVDVGMQTAAVMPASMPPVEMPPPSAPPPADLAPMELPAAEAPTPAPTTAGLQTLVPSNPYMVAYPRPDAPAAPPSTSMPVEEIDCRDELKRLGVTFRDLAPINDGGACRIDHPVKVSAIGSVGMKPAATLSCRMAATFARWTRKELVPAARWKYFSGVKTIHQGSSYSCRRIARSRTPSQHSMGNALDIMRIELNNGRDIDVRKPGWFSFRQRGFLNTVRADGCSYFTTVLGPGYNYDHRNHFHFDIMPRRNGRVACR